MMRIRRAALTFVSLTVPFFLAACGEGEDAASSAADSAPGATASLTLHETGRQLVMSNCVACHAELEGGGLTRINDSRRTPEGWDMTLVRMMTFHGVPLAKDERRALVKYLSDTRGLAPSEAAPFRYALERQANLFETGHDPKLMEMCARCHSMARVGLQRRTKDEWELLMHMHVGQWPTLEYQALSRDRDWWDDANGWVLDDLAEAYPFDNVAWEEWKAADHQDLDGKWRTISYVPGSGYHHGTAEFTETSADEYTVRYDSVSPSGERSDGSYKGIMYSGFEWRGRGDGVQEVAALSDDGNSLVGRWFHSNQTEKGGTLFARRIGSDPIIMAVKGESLRQGTQSEISIIGTGLEGEIDLGPGITAEVVEASGDLIRARLTIAEDASPGRRSVRVGAISLADAVAVYDRVDRVAVTPDYGVGRVGGDGGTEPKETVQFEAVAMHNGADGEPGTDDDFRIGVMDADWSVVPTDETAEMMQDVEFAGEISDGGLFTPAAAGPNPERRFGTNNAGDLQVIASVTDGDREVMGQARLIVTVQRWNNPPIY